MLFRTKILEMLTNAKTRFFKCRVLANQLHHFTQYTSGGDDYCPLINTEALGGTISNNPAHGFIFGWVDATEKKTAPGEKRIFAVNADNIPVAELHLKNDGKINVSGSGNVINVPEGVATINATTVNLGGDGGAFVLTENSQIMDGENRPCTITSNTTKTKAV